MSEHLKEEIILSHLEGAPLTPTARQHLDSCKQCAARVEEYRLLLSLMEDARETDPPGLIKWQVEAAVEEENARVSANRFPWVRIAAAVLLLIVGYAAGRWTPASSSVSEEIAALKQQVTLLRELTMTSALQQYSASQRIQAVNRIEEIPEKPGEKLISTLIETLNTDESPNVRYAAAQALGRYMEFENVRSELVKSLRQQQDPLIQILLINLLVEAEEKRAAAPMRELLERESTSPEVKHHAEIALRILI